MFFRMIKGALFRQKSKMIMIAVTIALGASLATAMLNIMLDVGDKVNQELKAYGANITVVPKELLCSPTCTRSTDRRKPPRHT